MNIFEKLLKIANEIGVVNKNLEVGYGSSKYKAVSEGDVLKAVKSLELKYLVYSYPVDRKIVESGVVENVKNGEVKKNLFERIETTYRFVNVEQPEEFIDVISYGDGIDSQDKSVGKAMTYADKYALLKAYKIVTGDDPDQEASQELYNVAPSKPITAEQLAIIAKIGDIAQTYATKRYRKDVASLTEDEAQALIEAYQRKNGVK